MLKKSLFLKVLFGEKVERPPVWFMRQAGRALQSYRNLKEKYQFSELLNSPELACQVSLLPEYALDIDALILFSDILVIPEALGIVVDYENGGPKMKQPLKLTDGQLPKNGNSQALERVYNTIKTIKQSTTDKPLIGFCGCPFTVYLYIYQGSGHQGNFDEALSFFYKEPKKCDQLLATITDLTIEYALKQITCGVDTFQLFETWANLLPAEIYFERIMPHVLRIAKAINHQVPLIFFPRFFSNAYELLVPYLSYFSAISIDYLNSIKKINSFFPKHIALQGNLDPHMVKFLDADSLSKYLDDYLGFFKEKNNWIVNYGHGVLPGTPESNLKLIVDKVKSLV